MERIQAKKTLSEKDQKIFFSEKDADEQFNYGLKVLYAGLLAVKVP
jgi:hypothetical protein